MQQGKTKVRTFIGAATKNVFIMSLVYNQRPFELKLDCLTRAPREIRDTFSTNPEWVRADRGGDGEL